MATDKNANTPKAEKAPVSLGDKIKQQLNAAVLRNKITLDELSDLEQHIKKVAGLLA
jgi:hypothetical protein